MQQIQHETEMPTFFFQVINFWSSHCISLYFEHSIWETIFEKNTNLELFGFFGQKKFVFIETSEENKLTAAI